MGKGTDSEIFKNNLTIIWILGSVALDCITDVCGTTEYDFLSLLQTTVTVGFFCISI